MEQGLPVLLPAMAVNLAVAANVSLLFSSITDNCRDLKGDVHTRVPQHGSLARAGNEGRVHHGCAQMGGLEGGRLQGV